MRDNQIATEDASSRFLSTAGTFLPVDLAKLCVINPLHVILWKSIAIISLVIAAVGVVLPVLPTVPFVILAAWAGSKGWPQLERWLLEHPVHGPIIQRWRDNRAVPRKAKILAVVMMSVSALLLVLSPANLWIKILTPTVMAVVAVWLWQHPDE